MVESGTWHYNRDTSCFKMAAPGNSKVENHLHKLQSVNLQDKKIIFFLYAADLSYVQRAFWMQLVETAEDPFNRIYMASLQLMTVCHSS